MKKIEINNNRLSAAVRTTDALVAFKSAVENGQSRLALDILEDILPSIISRIDTLEDLATEVRPTSAPVATAPVATEPKTTEVAPKAVGKPKEVKATLKDAAEADS